MKCTYAQAEQEFSELSDDEYHDYDTENGKK